MLINFIELDKSEKDQLGKGKLVKAQKKNHYKLMPLKFYGL